MDANIVIAALLRDSSTRYLIAVGGHELHAPRLLVEEIEEHWMEISDRSGIPGESLREIFQVLRVFIIEHEVADYRKRLEEASTILAGGDVEDAPYVALLLAMAADGIWTQDRRLLELPAVKTFRTSDLLR